MKSVLVSTTGKKSYVLRMEWLPCGSLTSRTKRLRYARTYSHGSQAVPTKHWPDGDHGKAGPDAAFCRRIPTIVTNDRRKSSSGMARLARSGDGVSEVC